MDWGHLLESLLFAGITGLIFWIQWYLFDQLNDHKEKMRKVILALLNEELAPLQQHTQKLDRTLSQYQEQLSKVSVFIERYNQQHDLQKAPEDPLEILAEEHRRFARSKSQER